MKYINNSKQLLRLRVTSFKLHDHQSGQTLIETIAAIFILSMAITAGLALAIYAFAASNTAQSQIISTNLAREGVEVIRMMRDSNWLAGEAAGSPWALTTCADLPAGKQNCYPSAFGGPTYNIANSGPGGNERVNFNAATNAWSLDTVADYNLYLQPNGTYNNTNTGALSVFARMVNISFNTAGPAYTVQNPEMIVKSVVAWRGKNCPSFTTSTNLLTLISQCKVVVEEHLTNWKDY
jgi:type II secretory pathway pseudopilin PulG